MLVLSRKPGQRILIGPNIEIVVAEIRGGQVKLGFECPSQIRVIREELQWLPVAIRTNDAKDDVNSYVFPESA
jgi:carbon storage regulator